MYKLDEYKNAIENTNIVSKTDINGIITFVNDEFCKLSGYKRSELIGQNHNIIRHPETPKKAFEDLWNTILQKKVHKAIVKNLKKNGDFFYAQTTIIPILDENQDIYEFIAIRHDVTELFRLNEELKNTKEELKALNENLEQEVAKKTKTLKDLNENLEKKIQKAVELNNKQQKIIFQQNRQVILGQTIENIAHQWRQPLNELSLALYLLKTEKDNKHYNQCQKLIQNMSQTINDFYSFASPNKPLNENILPKIIKKSLQFTYSALKKSGIKLRFNIDKKSYQIPIMCNSSELAQAFINIINNSKDALKQINKQEKLIIININIEKNAIILSFCDNAGGIAENIIENIFDPYFTTKHKKQGVGLGLYICKQILDSIEAKIRCYNTSDGVCFEIIFKESKC